MRAVMIFAIALLVISVYSAALRTETADPPPKLPVYVGLGYNLVTGNPLSKSVD